MIRNFLNLFFFFNQKSHQWSLIHQKYDPKSKSAEFEYPMVNSVEFDAVPF